ncbi:MAG: OmpA family protein, partial [Myxococcota bacterium]
MIRPLAILLAASLLGGCGTKKIKALEAELSDRDATIGELQTQNSGYVVELESLRSELGKLKKENAELAAFYEKLFSEFGPQIERGEAFVVVYGDRTVVALGEQIVFESGSAKLTSEGRAAVAKLAEVLRAHPGRRFQVEGHTDARPISTARYPSNWELGADRAIVVVRALVEAGVPSTQLSAATYADTSPFAANDHDGGMAQNRRIYVALQPTLEDTGAQAKLYRAAKTHGRAWLALGAPADAAPTASIAPTSEEAVPVPDEETPETEA